MTKITNTNSDVYYYDLTDYKQTVPVLPKQLYDSWFDQSSGLKWVTVPAKGGATIPFYDVLGNVKKVRYTTTNIIKRTKGKKVLVDHNFNDYYVDDVGDVISNNHYIFFYDDNKERDCIINTLQFLIDNNLRDLFKNRGGFVNTYIPAIRRKND